MFLGGTSRNADLVLANELLVRSFPLVVVDQGVSTRVGSPNVAFVLFREPILRFRRLSISKVVCNAVSMFACLVTIEVRRKSRASAGLVRGFAGFVAFSSDPITFVKSTMVFYGKRGVFQRVSISTFRSTRASGTNVALSGLGRKSRSIVVASSSRSRLSGVSVSLSRFPRYRMCFFVDSRLFY